MEPYPYDPILWGWWWEQQVEPDDDAGPTDAGPTEPAPPEFRARYEAIIEQDRARMAEVFRT